MQILNLDIKQKIVTGLIVLLALNGTSEALFFAEWSALTPYALTIVLAVLVTSIGAFFARPWGVIGLWLIMAAIVYLALFLRFGLGQPRHVLLIMALCSSVFMLILFPIFKAMVLSSISAQRAVQLVCLLPLMFTAFMLHSGLSTSEDLDHFLRNYISQFRLLPIVIQNTIAAIVTAAVVALPIAWGYRQYWAWVACLIAIPTILVFTPGVFEATRVIVKLLDIYALVIFLLFLLSLTQRAVLFLDGRQNLRKNVR